MKNHKLFSLFLVLPIALLALTACGNKAANTTGTNSDIQSVDTNTPSQQTSADQGVTNSSPEPTLTNPSMGAPEPTNVTPGSVQTSKKVLPPTKAPGVAILPHSAPLNLDVVAKHNSATDCWQAIDGQVYDLTSYVKSGAHPGGDKIVNGCGKDASVMFKMVGKHNNGARNILPSYLIGTLQK